MLAKQIQELRLNPPLVSNLDSEFLIRGQFLDECFQARQKLHAGLKYFAVEVGKLKQEWTQPAAQYTTHRFHELLKFFVAFEQTFLVRDFVENLCRNYKILGRLVFPASNGGSRGARVKSGINLDRLKFCGVEAEKLR